METLFDKVAQKVEVNDVFILYLAGHGMTNETDGLFYFLPYRINEVNNNTLSTQAISVNDIKSHLNKINTNNFLVLLDTCNSGSFIDNTLISEEALGRLSHRNKRNYIVASSKTQVALEGYKGDGVLPMRYLKHLKKLIPQM